MEFLTIQIFLNFDDAIVDIIAHDVAQASDHAILQAIVHVIDHVIDYLKIY